jgi:uncharacterized membrane protein (UPF0127 family)
MTKAGIVSQSVPGQWRAGSKALCARLMQIMVAAVAVSSLAASGAWAQEGPQKLRTIQLHAGMQNITAEVAMTDRERAIGLMHRTQMGTHEGMLFVFERPGVQCFWMKNTLIPLSVAFIDDDGTIVNVDEMKPQTLDSHCSDRPVRYVLEMNTGWFKKRALDTGSKLTGQPFTAIR